MSNPTNDLFASIQIFAGNFPPDGYAFCDGTKLPIGQYTALFSLLGTTYGGDGVTNFALPNLGVAEKSLGGARYIICINGLFPSRGDPLVTTPPPAAAAAPVAKPAPVVPAKKPAPATAPAKKPILAVKSKAPVVKKPAPIAKKKR